MEAQQIVIDQLKSMATGAIETLPQIVAAVIILIITWLVARLVRKLVVKLTGSRLRPSLNGCSSTLPVSGYGCWG